MPEAGKETISCILNIVYCIFCCKHAQGHYFVLQSSSLPQAGHFMRWQAVQHLPLFEFASESRSMHFDLVYCCTVR
jgi:hypothetical protein